MRCYPRATVGGSPRWDGSNLGGRVERAATQLRSDFTRSFRSDACLPISTPSNAKRFRSFRLSAFPADSGVSDSRRDFESPLWLLQGLAALVLVIASANLANLLMARASAREKEMGMRMAVGAGRGRLIRQLLAESLLLAAIGATLGALSRSQLEPGIGRRRSAHSAIRLFVDLGTDWRVLGFTTGLAVLTCILFGLAPALRATSVSPGYRT